MFDIIIPLRSGSSGLKDKNILKFKNEYLVNFLIKKIIKIKLINKIFILTDSNSYKNKIVNHKKINLNYIRPKFLSKKNSLVNDLIKDFINWSEKKNLDLKNIILMQVTSPLLKKKEIEKTLEFIKKKRISSLFHVSEVVEHPNHIINGFKKSWKYIIKNNKSQNRQKFSKYYFINGSFYYFTKDFFKKYKTPYNKKSHAFKIDKINFIDINTIFDFEIAKKIVNNKIRN